MKSQHQEINVETNREKYVGGSDLASIIGVSPYKSQFETALEKAEITKTKFKGNEYTKYGHLLEPAIRDFVNKEYGFNFIEDSNVNEEKHIRSNCDGYDSEKRVILEVKTYGAKASYDIYYPQIQLYMWQFDCDSARLAIYKRKEDFFYYDENGECVITDTKFDENRLQVSTIERDDEYISMLLFEIERFWERVGYLKKHPDITEEEYYSASNKELPMLIEDVEKASLVLSNIEEQYKIAKSNKEEVMKLLFDNMVEFNIKSFDSELVKITRVDDSVSTRVDSKKLKKDYPDIYDEVLTESNRKGYVKVTLKE